MKLLMSSERDETGMLVVGVPVILGCISQGKTEQEDPNTIREAIAGRLAIRSAHGTESRGFVRPRPQFANRRALTATTLLSAFLWSGPLLSQERAVELEKEIRDARLDPELQKRRKAVIDRANGSVRPTSAIELGVAGLVVIYGVPDFLGPIVTTSLGHGRPTNVIASEMATNLVFRRQVINELRSSEEARMRQRKFRMRIPAATASAFMLYERYEALYRERVELEGKGPPWFVSAGPRHSLSGVDFVKRRIAYHVALALSQYQAITESGKPIGFDESDPLKAYENEYRVLVDFIDFLTRRLDGSGESFAKLHRPEIALSEIKAFNLKNEQRIEYEMSNEPDGSLMLRFGLIVWHKLIEQMFLTTCFDEKLNDENIRRALKIANQGCYAMKESISKALDAGK